MKEEPQAGRREQLPPQCLVEGQLWELLKPQTAAAAEVLELRQVGLRSLKLGFAVLMVLCRQLSPAAVVPELR